MSDLQTRLRRFIEDRLPWFDPLVERQRNARTEGIRRRSIASRIRAERVIADYRDAERVSDRAADELVNEIRRDDDR